MGKSKKKVYYVQIRSELGTLRKIEAENDDEARKLATEKFGDSEGGVKWVIGILRRNGDQVKPWENKILKYI